MYSQPILRGHLLGQRKGDCYLQVITWAGVTVSVVSILYFVYMIEIIG